MAEMKLVNNNNNNNNIVNNNNNNNSTRQKKNQIDLSQEELFDLQCLIKANDISHATQCEFHQGQFLAFVSGSSDLGLYYLRDSSPPIIKRVPWFQGLRKKITCLCFDPLGYWLLIASVDGSLFILPARNLVENCHSQEQKWTTRDITSFSSLNAQNNYAR